MDKKEQQLIGYYYEKFLSRRFDEKDIYAFLSIARNSAETNKVIYALSDFVINRENSSGYVKEYLDQCKQIINGIGKEKTIKKIEDIFSFKEIRNGFNSLFVSVGFEKLTAAIINDIILCMISLLQSVKLVSGSLNKEVGFLSFAVSSKEVFLMGNMKILTKGRYIPVTFQVLSVQNIYEKVTPQDRNDTPYLFNDELIEVISIDEQLVITFPNLV